MTIHRERRLGDRDAEDVVVVADDENQPLTPVGKDGPRHRRRHRQHHHEKSGSAASDNRIT